MNGEFDLDFKEIDDLLKALPDAAQEKVVLQAARAGGAVIRNAAKENAPYDDSRTSGTHLRDAIKVKKIRKTGQFTAGVTVGVKSKDAPHGHLVEYGTVNHKAYPFFVPAYLAVKETAIKTMQGKMIRAIKNTAKRIGRGR